MYRKLLILILPLYFVMQLFSLQAQDVITVLGGNGTGSGGSVSYSVGQIGYHQFSGSNGFIIQGVQQAYEISVATSIENALNIALDCSVFPNPTSDVLILNVENYDNNIGDLSYYIFDNTGKLICNKQIMSNETSIVLADFISSIYFLKVTDGNREFITFKILKK